MYKTVRHGENSLQYTILPQTEEVLSNSGLKGKGRDYSPSIHVRRSRRKSTVKYVLLVLFGIIIALALAAVPLYVMNGALLARRNLQNRNEVITTAPLASSAVREMAKSRKKELKMLPEVVLTLGQNTEISTTVTIPTTTSSPPSTVTREKTTTPPWAMPALRSWKGSTSATVPPPPAKLNEDSFIGSSNNDHLRDDLSVKSWEKDTIIRATVTPETITLRNILKYYSRSYIPSEKAIAANTKAFDDVLITTKPTTTSKNVVATDFTMTSDKDKLKSLKDVMLSVDDDIEFKEALEVDDEFSLPPLKPDYASPGTDSDEVTVSKTGEGGWYGARWPFVDTSSYFQWTGYSPGDNLLLPLLVSALSSIALVLLLALAVRRRKRTFIVSSQIGKLTTDLQADDNTNLLTAENAEEGEE